MIDQNTASTLSMALRLREQGQLAEAAALCHHVLRSAPEEPSALNILAMLAGQQGRLDEAAALARRVLRHTPDDVAALLTLGHCLRHLGRFAEAATWFRRAALLQPGHVDALLNIGLCLEQAGERAEAVQAYRQVLQVQAGHFQALTRLGMLLGPGAPESPRLFKRAVEAQPESPEAHYNLANALAAVEAFEAALPFYAAAIALKPDYAHAHINLGVALRNLGRLDEAEAVYGRAIQLLPDSAEAHFNLSQILLLKGDFARGWTEYQWRLRAPAQYRRQMAFDQPEWQGEPVAGKTVLVHVEQGLGDVIQMVRFVPRLAAMGARVVLEVQPELVALMGTLAGVQRIVAHGDPLPPFDVQVPVMSLAGLFGTGLDGTAATRPYLAADPAKVDAWRRRLGSAAGLKVGVVWAGSRTHQADRMRSIPAPMLLPRLMQPSARLFSLQKEPRPGESDYLKGMGDAIVDLGPDLRDFTDTAAAMAALDLIISVDSAPAHLAGAMGRPVWLLTPFAPDWRWMLEREDTPWYPSMRLFRQDCPTNWDEALTHVALSLKDAARQAPTGRPPHAVTR